MVDIANPGGGMLSQQAATEATPQAAPQAAPQMVQPQAERDYASNPLNDEDMGNVNKFIAMATKVIHSPETQDKVLGRIKGTQHPYSEIADAAVVVMERVEQEGLKNGQPWDQAVKLMGGTNIVGQVIELAGAAGKIPQEVPEEDFRVILAQAIQQYTKKKIATGEMTQEQAARDAHIAAQTQAKMQGADTTKVNQQLSATQTAGNRVSSARDPAPLSAPAPAADPMRPETTMKEVLATKGGGLING